VAGSELKLSDDDESILTERNPMVDKEKDADSYYPIFASLRRKICLVVGGGSVGERKIRSLMQYGAVVRLVAQTLTPWLQAQCDNGSMTLVSDHYEEAQLEAVDLVFAATNNPQLNRAIAEQAENRSIWCNTATQPEFGSFIVPAIYRQGPLSIAVSTSGLSPALARDIRDQLKQQFGPEWIPTLKLLGRLRTLVQSKGLPTLENQRLFREISRLPLQNWLKEEQQHLAFHAIAEICQPWLTQDELRQALGEP
jgi:precorrin-2 dehydrogenase / sirohydrochlorin ferrochelatase